MTEARAIRTAAALVRFFILEPSPERPFVCTMGLVSPVLLEERQQAGLAWLAFFGDPEQDTFERLAEAIGVSISITALLALLAFIFSWQVSSIALVVFYLLLVPPAIWALRHWWIERKPGEETVGHSIENHPSNGTTIDTNGTWFSAECSPPCGR